VGRYEKEQLPPAEDGLYHPGDVSDEAYVKRLVEDTVAKFGKLDVLVNNAGMAIFGPFAQSTTQDWRKVMGTDLDSVYFASREALPHLLKTKGSIVNPRVGRAPPNSRHPKFHKPRVTDIGGTAQRSGLRCEGGELQLLTCLQPDALVPQRPSDYETRSQHSRSLGCAKQVSADFTIISPDEVSEGSFDVNCSG
jgi:hypothetical protein